MPLSFGGKAAANPVGIGSGIVEIYVHHGQRKHRFRALFASPVFQEGCSIGRPIAGICQKSLKLCIGHRVLIDKEWREVDVSRIMMYESIVWHTQ